MGIYTLKDYKKEFKYGIYTTQLELFILMNNNKMIKNWWIQKFEFIPSIIIYINNKNKLKEISSFNIEMLLNESVSIFRLIYLSRIHYEVLILKDECKKVKNQLRLNTIMNFYS